MRPELGFYIKESIMAKMASLRFSKGPGIITKEEDFTYEGHQSPGSWHLFLFFAVNQRWAYLSENLAILTKFGDSEPSECGGGRGALSFRGPERFPFVGLLSWRRL